MSRNHIEQLLALDRAALDRLKAGAVAMRARTPADDLGVVTALALAAQPMGETRAGDLLVETADGGDVPFSLNVERFPLESLMRHRAGSDAQQYRQRARRTLNGLTRHASDMRAQQH